MQVGSHTAARIGSFWTRMAATSRRCMSQIHRAVGILSFRVHMYWLSLLQARSPENSLKEIKFKEIFNICLQFPRLLLVAEEKAYRLLVLG